MAEVVWTKKALSQYERAIRYIREESGTSYAASVIKKVDKQVGMLYDYPQIGTLEPLLKYKKFEYRFLVAWSYKIIYRVSGDKCIISRFFHTSQEPGKLFK